MAQRTKLAIFDIDGTLFRSSLVIELIRQLVEQKTFPKKVMGQIEADYLAWLDRRGSYEAYITQIVKIYFANIKGKKKTDVARAVKKVLEIHKDRVYRYTRDLIKTLKAQGYFLMTISGSPAEVVTPFAQIYGFQESFGRIFEVKNGKFTGVVTNDSQMSNRKDEIVKNFIAEKKMEVDLENSYAVGDTETEIPLLGMVGKPIAFNPNKELAETAKAKGWQIIVERKDVIYETKDFNFV